MTARSDLQVALDGPDVPVVETMPAPVTIGDMWAQRPARLFEPAPEQLAGQLGMDGLDD